MLMVGMVPGAVHYSVDFTPVRQASKVPVVDVDIGNEFCGGCLVGKGETAHGSVAVHGVKR